MKSLIRYLYKTFVNEVFIPKGHATLYFQPDKSLEEFRNLPYTMKVYTLNNRWTLGVTVKTKKGWSDGFVNSLKEK